MITSDHVVYEVSEITDPIERNTSSSLGLSVKSLVQSCLSKLGASVNGGEAAGQHNVAALTEESNQVRR